MIVGTSPFEIPAPGNFNATYLAEVVGVGDPGGVPRVQVRLLNCDGVADQDGPMWARVAVPFAGDKRGAYLLPDRGDEVLVSFLNGDPRCPIVVGGLWNGKDKAPERLGGDGKQVDRWTIKGRRGTRIAIVEDPAGKPTICFTTPGKVSGQLTDDGGGKIELRVGGTTITLDRQAVTVETGGTVNVRAGQVQIKAGTVTVDAAMSKFTGMVKCLALQADTVMAGVYKPGAGNVW